MPASVAAAIGWASACALVAAITIAVGLDWVAFSMIDTSLATSVSALAPSLEIVTPSFLAAASAPSKTVAQYCDVVAFTITGMRTWAKSAAAAGVAARARAVVASRESFNMRIHLSLGSPLSR